MRDRPEVAFVIGGQGTQEVGMGKYLYDVSARARGFFERASKVVGYDVAELCFADPLKRLKGDKQAGISADPEAIQVGLFTTGVAEAEELKASGVVPKVIVAQSAAQYTGLGIGEAGVFEPLLKFVQKRGKDMGEAQRQLQMRVALVFGMEGEKIKAALGQLRQELGIGEQEPGYEHTAKNTPTRSLVAGPMEHFTAMKAKLVEYGGKVIPYFDSPPSHHSILARWQEALNPHLPDLTDSRFGIINDVTNDILSKAAEIKNRAQSHLTKPIDIDANLRKAAGLGINDFIFIGPSTVMAGMVEEVLPDARRHPLDTLEQFGDLINYLGARRPSFLPATN